jgi:hypothetical protein
MRMTRKQKITEPGLLLNNLLSKIPAISLAAFLLSGLFSCISSSPKLMVLEKFSTERKHIEINTSRILPQSITSVNAALTKKIISNDIHRSLTQYLDSVGEINKKIILDDSLRFRSYLKVKKRDYAGVLKAENDALASAEKVNRNVTFINEMFNSEVLKAKLEIKKTAEASDDVNRKVLEEIFKAESANKSKLDSKEIDEKSSQSIGTYLDSIKIVTQNHINDNAVVVSGKVSHSNINSVANKVKELLGEAKNNLGNVELINDLLGTNTFTRINLSSLFGPGEFTPDENFISSKKPLFEPVVDSILKFAGKFPNKKLTASIIVLGYADAGQINPSSSLAKKLVISAGNNEASSSELNKELSRLRASAIADLMKMISDEKKGDKPEFSKFSVETIAQGRGEELPEPSVKYTANDKRRRIVKVYWIVLP